LIRFNNGRVGFVKEKIITKKGVKNNAKTTN